MSDKNYEAERLLADMANANAWLVFTAAQATHDERLYGEWRMDYHGQASTFQRDFDTAGRALMALLGGGENG
jgi:hypothetical protein